MAKRVKVNLFGKAGQRSVEVTARGGFPTRHIKVPYDPVPSIFSPVTPEMVEAEQKANRAAPVQNPRPDTKPRPKPDPVVDPDAVLDVLQKMTQDANPKAADPGWFIIDEVLVVATAKFGIRANHTTLLDAFRTLYRQGQVAHKTNRWNQHLFRLVPQNSETDLNALLAEVDKIIKETPSAYAI